MKIMYLKLALLLCTGSTYALSAAKFAESVAAKNQELEAQNPVIEVVPDNGDTSVNGHCSRFLKSCLDLCENQVINTITTKCSASEASCLCNEVEISSDIFNVMLKEGRSVDNADTNRVQMNAASINFKQSTSEDSEGQQEEDPTMMSAQEVQPIEFIHPNLRAVKNVQFQETYCAKFMIRCKQDCPAAFSAYECNVNTSKTGFLLSCVCNNVDIAASVAAQVQAEM